MGEAFLAAGREVMTKCGKEDLAELASSYVKRLFLDDFLNELLSTEPFSEDLLAVRYVTTNKNQETAQLAEKGSRAEPVAERCLSRD